MPRIPPELAMSQTPKGSDGMALLGQVAAISEIDELGCGEWTVLYEYQNGLARSRCSYSGLLTSSQVVDALKHDNWDLRIGLGTPSFSQNRQDAVEVVEYDRFGFDGVEPVVYPRDFHGIKPSQFDLSEELRLFHNLYHDRINDRYVHVDSRGNESVVAEVTAGHVRVLTRFLRQYMAARQLALALFFDHRADADVDFKVAKKALPSKKIVAADRNYSFHVGELMGRSFSRLIGKKIIMPPPTEQSGVWPYEMEQRDKHAEFIIDVDEGGLPIFHSCDPEDLANYFGANETAPHYLTPVWFKREVLGKYYNDPEKFSVEDGYLHCGSLWGLRMDNNLADHVVVYLGDLGRDLNYEEQTYWKLHNVTPGGRTPSETNFRRAFLAQFADPSAPDLLFRQDYTQLKETWTKKFGWSIFRPLHAADADILRQIRIPITESLGEFETQLLLLVKLLIDSLNEAELTRACPGDTADEKGISKFKRYLESQLYPYIERDISLLRTLQDLRSSGVAHAKGRNFDKIQKRVGLDVDSPRDMFRSLVLRVNQMLSDICAHFIPAGD